MTFPNRSNTQNTSFLATNDSFFEDFEYYQPLRPEWYWVIMGLIGVVTTVGNVLVICLICSKRSFRNKASPNWFILSLGVSDFLIGAYNIPVQFLCSFTTKCTHLGSNIMHCIISLFLTASTTNVCLLTFDIYLAVFHPFWYPNLMSPSKSRIFIFSAWLLSAVVNIAMYISALYPLGNEKAEYADQMIGILFYTLSGAFLVYAFGRILLVVRSHKRDIEKHQLQVASNGNSHDVDSIVSSDPCARVRRRNRDGTITATGVVTASFIICNGLFLYFLLYKLLSRRWKVELPMSFTMIDVTHLVVYFNSTMNFIVYALLRNDLRGELESYFKRFFMKGTVDHSEFINLQNRQRNRQTRTSFLRSTKDRDTE